MRGYTYRLKGSLPAPKSREGWSRCLLWSSDLWRIRHHFVALCRCIWFSCFASSRVVRVPIALFGFRSPFEYPVNLLGCISVSNVIFHHGSSYVRRQLSEAARIAPLAAGTA